jgi:hypothetical protein
MRLLAAGAGGEDLALDLEKEIPLPATESRAKDGSGEAFRVIVDAAERVGEFLVVRTQSQAP